MKIEDEEENEIPIKYFLKGLHSNQMQIMSGYKYSTEATTFYLSPSAYHCCLAENG